MISKKVFFVSNSNFGKMFLLALAFGTVFLSPSVFGFEQKNLSSAPEEGMVLVESFAPTPFIVPSSPSSLSFEPASLVQHNISASVGHSRGSSLSWGEALLVSGGGRNYDFSSKKWVERKPFSGEKLNKFKLSWEANRKRSNAVGLPSKELYSKNE